MRDINTDVVGWLWYLAHLNKIAENEWIVVDSYNYAIQHIEQGYISIEPEILHSTLQSNNFVRWQNLNNHVSSKNLVAKCSFCRDCDNGFNTIFGGSKVIWSQCRNCQAQGHLGHFLTKNKTKYHWRKTQYCADCKYPKKGAYIKSPGHSYDCLILQKYGCYIFEISNNQQAFLLLTREKYIWYEPQHLNINKFYQELFEYKHLSIQNESFYHFKMKYPVNINMKLSSININYNWLLTVANIKKYDFKYEYKADTIETFVSKASRQLADDSEEEEDIDCHSTAEHLPLTSYLQNHCKDRLSRLWDDMTSFVSSSTNKKTIKYYQYYNGGEFHLAPVGIKHFRNVLDKSTCDYLYQVQDLLMRKVSQDQHFMQKYGGAFHNFCEYCRKSKKYKYIDNRYNRLHWKIMVNGQYRVDDDKYAELDENIHKMGQKIWKTDVLKSPLKDIRHYGLNLASKIIYQNFGECCRVVDGKYVPKFNGYHFMIYNGHNGGSYSLKFHRDNTLLLNDGCVIPCANIAGIGGVSFFPSLENHIKNMQNITLAEYETSDFGNYTLIKRPGDIYTMDNEIVKYYEHGVINPSKIGVKNNLQSKQSQKSKNSRIPRPISVSIVGRYFPFKLFEY